MKLNKENQDFKYKLFIEQMEQRHRNEIAKLQSHIDTLKNNKWF